MIKILIPFILMIMASFSLQAEEDIHATTKAGLNVILYSDGTWAFTEEPPVDIQPQVDNTPLDLSLPELTAEAVAEPAPKINKSFLRDKAGIYEVFYDKGLWKHNKSGNKDAAIQLEHVNGNGYAMLIFESTSVTLDELKKQALSNVRQVASKAEIVSSKRKWINGHEIMILKINSSMEGLSVSYLNYYAVGKWGAIQFVTYIESALLPKYENDLTDLLNGLTIK